MRDQVRLSFDEYADCVCVCACVFACFYEHAVLGCDFMDMQGAGVF